MKKMLLPDFNILYVCLIRDESMKQIILPFGKLGNEIYIIGGRGNGLYINLRRKNHHGLTTADEIIQVFLLAMIGGVCMHLSI